MKGERVSDDQQLWKKDGFSLIVKVRTSMVHLETRRDMPSLEDKRWHSKKWRVIVYQSNHFKSKKDIISTKYFIWKRNRLTMYLTFSGTSPDLEVLVEWDYAKQK